MTTMVMTETREFGPRPITVALVNNMPDSAFVDTENQFRRAAAAADGAADVDFELYTITEIPRSEAIADGHRSRATGVSTSCGANPPDALIVTGTEPTQVQMSYEPYWPYLARLLEWAADARSHHPAVVSGVARERPAVRRDRAGAARRSSAAACSTARSRIRTTRWRSGCPNTSRSLTPGSTTCRSTRSSTPGYRIVIGSGASGAGWSVAARQQGDGLFVLCQGHPEYGTLSLLREYRRDVRRYLFGRGAVPLSPSARGLSVPRTRWPRSRSFARAGHRERPRIPSALWSASRSTKSRPPWRTRGPARRRRCTRTGCSLARAASAGLALIADMHDETLAIHGGYTPDSTRAVAVPIYQTVAHDFIDADHAGAIMDLETPGYPLQPHQQSRRSTCSSSGSPRSRAAPAAMAVSSGAAAVSMSVLNLRRRRRQLRVGSAALRRHLHLLRARASRARRRGPLRGGRSARSRSAR